MIRALLTTLFLLYANIAAAATYYVAQTGGDNGRSCMTAQNVATPKATIGNGMGCLSPGDTLFVRTGTYVESFPSGTVPSGNSSGASGSTWPNQVRIANYNGETVWVKPGVTGWVIQFANAQQYIEFDGINLDGENVDFDTVKINAIDAGNNAHHIRFKNLTALGTERCQNLLTSGCHVFIATALYSGAIGGNEFINVSVLRHRMPSTGYFSHAFYIQSSFNIIDHCLIDDTVGGWSGNGIQLFNGQAPGGTTVNNNTVRYCIIRNLTNTVDRQRGIEIGFQAQNNLIYGNLIYNLTGAVNPTAGIRFEGTGHQIYNNTTYDISAHGIRMDGGSGHILRNNISWGNATNFEIISGTVSASSNNLGDTETGWTNDDPDFITPGSDFHLQSVSPARNTGSNIAAVSNLVVTDIDGTARPQESQYDIGAYEFKVASPTPPTLTITAPTIDPTWGTGVSPMTVLAMACTDTDGTVTSMSWSNSGGGSGGVTCTGCGTASATGIVPSITLATGLNTITLECVDSSALTHQKQLGVTYSPPVPAGKRLRVVP